MKRNYIYTILALLMLCVISKAQLGVGIEVDSEGKILDFGKSPSNTRGIILPIVDIIPSGNYATNGTFIFDASDLKIKVRENDQWVSLSSNLGDLSEHTLNSASDIGGGMSIGDDNSDGAKGVLVLNAKDKALVLPHVYKPHENVESPYPGMICFDTFSKSLYVFNGKYWSIWRKSSNK